MAHASKDNDVPFLRASFHYLHTPTAFIKLLLHAVNTIAVYGGYAFALQNIVYRPGACLVAAIGAGARIGAVVGCCCCADVAVWRTSDVLWCGNIPF